MASQGAQDLSKEMEMEVEVEAETPRHESAAHAFPTEILDLIWHHVIRGTDPRIVDIRFDSATGALTSSCRSPTIMRVCSRARELALQTRWPLSFAVKVEGGDREPKIVFDFEQDTLYFGREFIDVPLFAKMVNRKETMRVRSMAFDMQALCESGLFSGTHFGRTMATKFHRDVRNALVLRGEEHSIYGRQGRMLSFVPAKDPWGRLDQDTRGFLGSYQRSWELAVGGQPVIGYVKVEKVVEGNEAWNLKPLEMTRKEQWKVRKQLC